MQAFQNLRHIGRTQAKMGRNKEAIEETANSFNSKQKAGMSSKANSHSQEGSRY